MVRRIPMHSDEDDYFVVDYGSTTQHTPPAARAASPAAAVMVTQPPSAEDVDALERGAQLDDDIPPRLLPFSGKESAAWVWRCCTACARHLHDCLPVFKFPAYQGVSRLEA